MSLPELQFDKRLSKIYERIARKDEILAKVIIQEMMVNPELGERLFRMYREGKEREVILWERDSFLKKFYNKRGGSEYILHATF